MPDVQCPIRVCGYVCRAPVPDNGNYFPVCADIALAVMLEVSYLFIFHMLHPPSLQNVMIAVLYWKRIKIL